MRETFMQYLPSERVSSRKIARGACLLGTASMFLCAIGCGSGKGNPGTTPDTPATPTTPTAGLQTYFSPYVVGTTNGAAKGLLTGPKIYTIDDTGNKFSQSTFQLQLPQQQGSQVINAGVTAAAQRGLLMLGITANYIPNATTNVFDATTYNPPKTGSFAVELANQTGGLVQLVGQPVAPLVAATQCPTLKTAQTYQFLTIPAGLIDSSSSGQQAGTWDPTTDTAYGSVDISSNGSSVTFNNIHQYTLPSVGGSGAPAQQPSSSVTGACGQTVFGDTITVGQLTVTNPRPGSGAATPPQASVGIGSTGLLVEHNGSGDPTNATFPGTSPALKYDNTLGAGTGAAGLPKPSSALDTNALRGAQYLGFVYGAGTYSGSSFAPPNGWSSHLASFGFSTVPSSCASVASATNTMIYGGDFANDDPTNSSNGFGNCDLAIDLGTQDASNNGLFSNATVWLGANYAANTTSKTYSFSAVAIAGQLNGKYALFLLGVDTNTNQPWAIYLLQSN